MQHTMTKEILTILSNDRIPYENINWLRLILNEVTINFINI